MVSERYDEIVFCEPTEQFAYVLDKGSKKVAAAQVDEEMKEIVEDNTEQKEGD